ncbi:insulin-like growth factor 1 receptor [Ptychodera flava]|uniref:insulin-like growth factor 1 receptor n=1 Tax=Ptychodera flava TaxID=63121 RepID=UPI003969D786
MPLLPQPIQIPDGVTVVKRSEVLIGHLLGEGEFSSVYFGRLRINGETTNVAVKILKDNTLYNPAYEHEISTLDILAGCPHIIKLLGVIIDGEKSIITELMTSDMYTILKSLRQENDFSATTGARLQKFCLEVAEALQYMTTMKIVHRDVAARNVLISHDDTAKIGDFGLARDIYQDLVYQRHPSQRHCKVPVRWMSPESLTENIYTLSSDMWSFGVLMWEVATLGDMPFYNIDSEQLVERLKAGDRLPRPPNCSEDFYELMKKCWRLDPKDRVTANVAVRILKHYIAYKRLPVAC